MQNRKNSNTYEYSHIFTLNNKHMIFIFYLAPNKWSSRYVKSVCDRFFKRVSGKHFLNGYSMVFKETCTKRMLIPKLLGRRPRCIEIAFNSTGSSYGDGIWNPLIFVQRVKVLECFWCSWNNMEFRNKRHRLIHSSISLVCYGLWTPV